MTHTSPLPPSEHSAGAIPVMFGESWTDPNGGAQIAEHDGVLIEFRGPDGQLMATRFQTPESAIALALIIQDAGVKAIKHGIGDDGKPPSAGERIARINAAYALVGR